MGGIAGTVLWQPESAFVRLWQPTNVPARSHCSTCWKIGAPEAGSSYERLLPAAAFAAMAASSRPRSCYAARKARSGQAAEPAASPLPRREPIAAAAVTGERKKKKKLISPQRRLERLFDEEFGKTMFSENPWYESPEVTTSGPERVHEHWMRKRPNREIERICDGKTSCGCTWKQLDGRRGVSFVSFNSEGRTNFAREVAEPSALSKFKSNNMQSLQPTFAVMNAFKTMFNFWEEYAVVEESNREPPRPKFGLEAPRSRRAADVVRYLWEEAYYSEVDPVAKLMAEYSADAVIEDLTYADGVYSAGWNEVKRYHEETKENSPENLRFVLDDVTDGEKACTALWHVEFNGRKSPRGVSFYELDDDGKVAYVRASYDVNF
eukprot:TRINITY_DN79278_c0_g1_i1.p1 TRINITY_DN79278_c0_g1~~TRINITY_DN79278_c0_g1_i1.p1  ORF type:complete len:379 (-),score=76.67 TRINITY_DN79278_c0_g1_i1:360-1496(-)